MTVKWISVYDQLPEPSEFVLAASTKNGHCGIARNIGGGLEWIWVFNFGHEEPNLWMSLPIVRKEAW